MSEAAGALQTLLANFVALARAPGDARVLEATLADTVALAVRLTGAERGGLLLLDREGRVTATLLGRGQASREETSRLVGTVLDRGLAGWVRRERKAAIVEDTARDPRWVALPGAAYEARSALAVPVLRGDELAGLLTLTHPEPRRFDAASAAVLELAAGQMALVLDNAALYQRLAEVNAALEAEMRAGQKMQRGFLPRALPAVDGYELAVRFQPARQVSGDLYDAFTRPGGAVVLVLGDVCGKGVGAALFMALVRSMLRLFCGEPAAALPAAAVARCSDYIADHHRDLAMFATLFLGVLQPETGALAYVNAGHDPLLLRRAEGTLETLGPTGPAVGMRRAARFEVKTLELRPGDVLLGYTDGVLDARSPEDVPFGEERLPGLLAAGSAEEAVARVDEAVRRHTGGGEPFDDLTLLALARR